MKKIDVIEIVNLLSRIKLNKISNPETKRVLVADFLRLSRIAKEIEGDKSILIEKFRADWGDEIREVQALRDAKKPVHGHDEYLNAELEANGHLSKMMAEEISVELQTIPVADFVDAIQDEEMMLGNMMPLFGIILS